jgi:exopolysaccharide production protein ExoZ
LTHHAVNRLEFETTNSATNHIGAYGVDLFFVISGFIVCNVARRAPTAIRFLRSRFIRVAPVYYILSAPWLAMVIGVGKFSLASLATTLLFWPIWAQGPTEPVFSVGWTLCFEALFYSSLGAIVQWGARAAVLLGATYAVALALNFAKAGAVFQFIGNPQMLEFLAGTAIAWMPIRNSPRAGLAAIAASLALLGIRYTYGIGLGPLSEMSEFDPLAALNRVVAAGPPAFLLVWGCLQLEPWFKGRVVGALSYLGDASYSIYLAHPAALYCVQEFWRITGLPLFGLPFACFVAGLGTGVLAYRTIEVPVLAFLRRPRPTAAAANVSG